MKKIMLSLAIIGTMMACKKESDVQVESLELASTNTITADDAAALAQYDVSSQTGGFNTLINDAANLAYTRNNASYCGKGKDSTVTKSSNGTYPNYPYSFTQKWSWLLTCTSLKVPSNLSYKVTTDGQYKTPNTTSVDTGTGDLTISGLEVQSANYAINGSYTRNGSQTVSVSSSKSLTSEVKLSAVSVQVNKSTLKVQAGGTAAVSITGKSGIGKTFTFTGTIKFNDGGSFTITINGKDYNVTI